MLLIAGFIIQKLKLTVSTDKASGSSCVSGLTPSKRPGPLSLLFAREFREPASEKGQREERVAHFVWAVRSSYKAFSDLLRKQ